MIKNIIILFIALLSITACNSKIEKTENDTEEIKIVETEQTVDKKVSEANIYDSYKLLTFDDKNIIQSIQISPSYSISDSLESLIADSKNVAIVKVLSYGESKIYQMNGFPYTKVNIELIKNLGREQFDRDSIEVVGGIVPLRNFGEFRDEGLLNKIGYYDASEEEKDNDYISIFPEHFKDLYEGGVYLMFLDYDEDRDVYYNTMDAFSIFTLEEDFSTAQGISNSIMQNNQVEIGAISFVKDVNGLVREEFTLKEIIDKLN